MSDTQRKILYNRLYKILDFITDGGCVFLFVLCYLTCCTVVMFIHTPTFVFMICLLMYLFINVYVISIYCYYGSVFYSQIYFSLEISKQIILWRF